MSAGDVRPYAAGCILKVQRALNKEPFIANGGVGRYDSLVMDTPFEPCVPLSANNNECAPPRLAFCCKIIISHT